MQRVGFRRDAPGRGQDAARPRTLADLVGSAARRSPAQGIRFIDEAESEELVSWCALADEATRVADGLRALGVGVGAPVIVATGTMRTTLPALWGALVAGAVPLLLPAPAQAAGMAATRLQGAWQGLGRPLVIGDAERLRPLFDAAARLASIETCRAAGAGVAAGSAPAGQGGDVALLLATSGTAGAPKLVAHTHAGVLTALEGSARATGLGPDDVTLNWLPLDHVGAVFRALRDALLGCNAVQVATGVVVAGPRAWMELAERHGVTSTWGPNFALGLLADSLTRAARPLDLRGLRSLLTTGETVVPGTVRRLAAALAPHGFRGSAIHATWGMTEAWSATVSREVVARLDGDEPVEAGPPIAGVALRIVDDEGRLVPEGTVGRLEVSGPACAAGYWRDGGVQRPPAAFTADGWLRTGDLGRLRAGRLTVTGREAESIIVNGVRHSCHELEAIAARVPTLPGVQAIACPVRSGADTEEVAVFIPGAFQPQEFEPMAAAVRERLTRDAGLAGVHVIAIDAAAIPRTALGKIQRGELARRLAEGGVERRPPASPQGLAERPEAGPAPGPAGAPVAATAENVARMLARVLGRPRIEPDESIFALGAGSLHVLRATAALQRLGGARRVAPVDIFAHPTARRLAALLRGEIDLSPAAEAGMRRGHGRRDRSAVTQDDRERRLLARKESG